MIAQSNLPDGFLLDKDGMLRSFPTKEETMAFAREEGLLINTKEDEFLLSSAILKFIIRKFKCKNMCIIK